jgi:autotransporter-associated beta strand protein
MTATDSGTTTNYVTKVGDPAYLGGSTLAISAGNRTFNTLHVDTSGGAGTLDLSAAQLTLTDKSVLVTGTNAFTIQNGVVGSATELVLHQFSTGALTMSALIGGSAGNAASLTKDGPGTLILSGSNLYTNATTVAEGTLAITGSVRGNVIATGATVATSGTVSLQNAGAVSLNTLSVTGSGKLVQTVANAISGSAAVTVNGFVGTATANLSLANSYSGTTTLTSGNLNLGDPAAIGTGTLSIGGGRLDNTTGAPMTLANNNAITFTGGTVFAGTNSLNFGTGAINLGTGVRTIIVSANTLTFGGSASGAGGGITKVGPGTLALNAANSYTGATSVSGGVLLLNDASALPGGIGATGGVANLSIAGGVLGLGAGDFTRPVGTNVTDVQFTTAGGGFAAFGANRVVNLGGAGATLTWSVANFLPNPNAASATFVLGAATADRTVDFQNPIILGTATATRTVQVDDGSAAVDAKLSGVLSSTGGTVGFTKVGNGTLELSAVNTYNGVTSVAAGKLLLTGALSGTSAVNVGGGATLGGSGSIATVANGSVTLFKGALLAPGNTVGTLTATLGAGQFDLSGAASGTGAFKFELGTTSDQIAVASGTLNIGSGVLNFDDFVFSDAGGFGAGTYTLVDTSAAVSGTLGTNLSGTISGLSATVSLSGDSQDVILTVVPEPGSALLLLGGLGTLLGIRRRRA